MVNNLILVWSLHYVGNENRRLENAIYKALKIIKGIYSVYVKGEKYTWTCGILLD